VYGDRTKGGLAKNLKSRYVPVMKRSLLDKLQVLRDLKGSINIRRGFIPPKESATRAPIRDNKSFSDISGRNTTGWLDRHAYGDAVDVKAGVSILRVAEVVGFDVVRFENHGGSMIHLDDRGYKLLHTVFNAPGNRSVDWPQFPEIAQVQTVLKELGGILHYVPQEFGPHSNVVATETEVVIWDTNYYNQTSYPDMSPTKDQKAFTARIKQRGCGPTSQRMQLEHFDRHPVKEDKAVAFQFGQTLSRKFILDDYVEHIEAHFGGLTRAASVSKLLFWANQLGRIDKSPFKMRWAHTRSFYGPQPNTGVEPRLMICSGGRADTISDRKPDYTRDHFEAQTLSPIEFIRNHIQTGPIQVLLMHNVTDNTTPFRRERYSGAKSSNDSGASAHYVLVAGYARITTKETGGNKTEEYIVLDDSGVHTGKLLLHKADSFLKAWAHRYAEYWLKPGGMCFANAIYRRPYKQELASEVELSNVVGRGTVASSAEIRAVQERLIELGFQAGNTGANGIFTTTDENIIDGVSYSTEAAIKRFQFTALEIDSPDGRVDPDGNTLKRLNAFDAIRWIQVTSNRVKFDNDLKNWFHPRLTRLLEDLGKWADGEGIDLQVQTGSEGFPGDGRHTTKRDKDHYRGLAVTLKPSSQAGKLKDQFANLEQRYLDVHYKQKNGDVFTIWIS